MNSKDFFEIMLKTVKFNWLSLAKQKKLLLLGFLSGFLSTLSGFVLYFREFTNPIYYLVLILLFGLVYLSSLWLRVAFVKAHNQNIEGSDIGSIALKSNIRETYRVILLDILLVLGLITFLGIVAASSFLVIFTPAFLKMAFAIFLFIGFATAFFFLIVPLIVVWNFTLYETILGRLSVRESYRVSRVIVRNKGLYKFNILFSLIASILYIVSGYLLTLPMTFLRWGMEIDMTGLLFVAISFVTLLSIYVIFFIYMISAITSINLGAWIFWWKYQKEKYTEISTVN